MYISKTKTHSFPLSEIKEHLNIHLTDNSKDSELKRLSKSAIEFTEKRIGSDISATSNVLEDYCVYGCYYRIDEPNISISAISATTSTGEVSVITAYTIYKYHSYTLIKFTTFINAEILRIVFTSGMSAIPEDLKSAILIKVGTLFDQDKNGFVQNTVYESKAYERIISQYKNLTAWQ